MAESVVGTLSMNQTEPKRFNAVSSAFLIDFARVHIESKSLSRFEELSHHPVFCRSIKNVEVNVSYYDTRLATDRGLFGRHCGGGLYQDLEVYELSLYYNPGRPSVDLSRLSSIPEEWDAVGSESFTEETSTEKQRFLLAVHSEYHRRYIDQEQVKQERAHLHRICAGLLRLPNLQSIAIDDDPNTRSQRREYRTFSDEELVEFCLRPSAWKGSFMTSSITAPPVEIIPELFQMLSQRGPWRSQSELLCQMISGACS
jgi:hypothetical protein